MSRIKNPTTVFKLSFGTAVIGIVTSMLAATMPAAAQNFGGQTIHWDTDNAVLGGSGCRKDVDAFIMEAGNDVSIVFSNLGVELADQYAPLQARKSCLARIGARIANGYYVGTLSQNVSFGIVKSPNSEATIGVRSNFAGYNLPPLNVKVGRNRRASGEIETASREDDFIVMGRRWCGRNIPVTYQAQLTAAGSRASIYDSVISQIDGLDVRFEATAGLFVCP